MTYSIRQLTNPTELELVAASKVLATAFKDDNFTQMTVGRDLELIRPFVNSVIVAGSMEGEIYVAEDAGGKIVGVAIWFGPGTEYCHSEAQQEKVLIPLLAHFDDDIQAWWNDKFLPDYNALIDEALGPGKLLGSWHLQLIGVSPEHQRKHLATKMIALVRDMAHAQGDDLVLEPTTEVKKAVYERMGFEAKGFKLIIGPKDCGESPMWSMIYPAPSKQAAATSK